MTPQSSTISAKLVLACVCVLASPGLAAPGLIISQGNTIYRYQNGNVQTSLVGDVINGMTNVPIGMTVGNMNGGATAGDILALGTTGVYRVDTPLTNPTLTQIGVRGGPNASPVFLNGWLFGVAGVLPQGSVVVEWDPVTFAEINRWATGVFGGPGGMVAVPNTTNEFYYSEFNSDMIWHYKLGDTISTPVCATPNNDYVGLEMIGGQIYASYAMPGINQFVVGIQSLNGTFNQLAVLDVYQAGITGLAELVPAPGSLVLAAAGLLTGRRRR